MRYLVFLSLIIATIVRAEYPTYFPKCHNGDSECLIRAANEVVRKYSSGLRDINLIPLEPLHLKSIILNANPSSPINLELTLRNIDIYGVKSTQVTSFNGLQADLSGRTVIEGFFPEMRLKGLYKVDGRILVLPLEGEGPFEIRIKNIKLKYGFDMKPVQKNGQIFAELFHSKMDMEADRLYFQLDNLFNGNKELGDSMNKFINENWREIYEELKPAYTKAMSLILKSLCNNLFDKFPYAEYFL